VVMASWNLGVAVMPPAFAGLFFGAAFTHSSRCGLLVYRRLLPTQAKNLIERISLPVKRNPSDCQSIIKRKRLKMP